jgi:hypothetical protein
MRGRRWGNLFGDLLIVATLSVGGCAGGDRDTAAMQSNSSFEETGAGRFRFTATLNGDYPADDQNAEALRRRWLRDDVVMSNRCSNGTATLVDREVIVEGTDAQTGAPVGKIVYEGDCN